MDWFKASEVAKQVTFEPTEHYSSNPKFKAYNVILNDKVIGKVESYKGYSARMSGRIATKVSHPTRWAFQAKDNYRQRGNDCTSRKNAVTELIQMLGVEA